MAEEKHNEFDKIEVQKIKRGMTKKPEGLTDDEEDNGEDNDEENDGQGYWEAFESERASRRIHIEDQNKENEDPN